MSMVMLTFVVSLILALFSGKSHEAWADVQESIPGLFVDVQHIQVRTENEGYPSQRIIATLSGTFQRVNSSLNDFENKPLLLAVSENVKRPFSIEVVLTSQRTSVPFIAVDPYGHVQKETIYLRCPQFEGRVTAAAEVPSLGSRFGIAVGLVHFSYSQTALTPFDETALSLKGSYQHPLSQSWDLGFNAYTDVISLSSSQPGISASYFGMNARVGYALPIHSSKWSVSVAGGFYYTTMFTSGLAFGFRNLFGPQLFPITRYALSTRDTLSLYYKYSPISPNFALSFSSHEQAAGLIWTHALPKRKTTSITLDFIQDSVNLATAGLQSNTNSVNLGFGYGF
jgi:hypothetical protein